MISRRSTFVAWFGVLACTACISGCRDTASLPGGQVVAIVNGNEITTSELEVEADEAGVDLSGAGARDRLLEAIVQRNLQAAAASERGLDKDPRFFARKRRAEQVILAQMYMLSARASAPEATVDEARLFILRNPQLFDSRELLDVDRLAFPLEGRLPDAELRSLMSLADAERLLRRKHLRFTRSSATVDPADLPPELVKPLTTLAPGKVFFGSTGSVGMFATILHRTPAPVPAEQQLSRAKAILTQREREKAARAAVTKLRNDAEIKYQPGFAPAANSEEASTHRGN